MPITINGKVFEYEDFVSLLPNRRLSTDQARIRLVEPDCLEPDEIQVGDAFIATKYLSVKEAKLALHYGLVAKLRTPCGKVNSIVDENGKIWYLHEIMKASW